MERRGLKNTPFIPSAVPTSSLSKEESSLENDGLSQLSNGENDCWVSGEKKERKRDGMNGKKGFFLMSKWGKICGKRKKADDNNGDDNDDDDNDDDDDDDYIDIIGKVKTERERERERVKMMSFWFRLKFS
ncbi:hypothetical protein WUBG_00660 [Wuchereria bancrofti]|uniref:Uncharacterized protein n=1 Tax=Wuchereria bancrofti TaxID=6293 RepID=J9F1Q7_WUCBA|nr:hypothetical protein WUBG_00660 [Wuchereria bancrofti]